MFSSYTLDAEGSTHDFEDANLEEVLINVKLVEHIKFILIIFINFFLLNDFLPTQMNKLFKGLVTFHLIKISSDEGLQRGPFLFIKWE